MNKQSMKLYQAYYDNLQGKRINIGFYNNIHDAVYARNAYEFLLLSSGKLSGEIEEIARHHDQTLWKLSFQQTSFC